MPVIQGYIVNNFLFSYINHSIEFCDVNNIQAENINFTMKLGTNAVMGLLGLSDYMGNDIWL
jgi:3-hydroxyacyl-CoA dehydrogenase